MTDIPDAAVEATATHLFLVDRRLKGLTPIAWKLATDFERTYFRAEAVLALEAAMPAIREAIAQEIGSKVPRDAPLSDYMHGMIAAREIVWDGVP